MRKNLLKRILTSSLAFTLSLSLMIPGSLTFADTKDNVTSTKSVSSTPIPDKVLVGYWHNFNNGTGTIRLRDVSPNWDVINLSFGEPTTVTSGDIQFSPFNATDEEFISDIEYLHSQGKKVLISIGGQNGQVQLSSQAARDAFVKSICGIIDKYGLDGLDIDFEGHSLSLNAGDTDFTNPTTPVIVNLISALKEITGKYGDDFVLTMAPETFFVQNGHSFYGGINTNVDSRCGAYLPVIHAMRSELDWLQVQYYNSGPIVDNNGKTQNMGSPEFFTSLADMLLTGFTINNDSNIFFPPLREDQVVVGVPSSQGAGNGYINNTEIEKGITALIKGGTVGGYTVSEAHPNLRGLMAWSINWDKYFNNAFSDHFRAYFDELDPPTPTLRAATLEASKVKDGKFTLTATIPSKNSATSYKILENNQVIYTGTLTAGQSSSVTITKEITGKPIGTYEYSVVLSDGSSSVTSNVVKVDTTPVLNQAPVLNGVKDQTVSYGDTFTALNGVTATDEEDGDLTKNIVVTGSVDTSKVGSYTLTYSVTDSEGLKTTATAIIKVAIETYSPTKEYTYGSVVEYNGIIYQSQAWWTYGIVPGTNDPVWKPIGKVEDDQTEVTIKDLSEVASKYNSKKGDANWSDSYDKNSDGVIDIFDLVLVAKQIK